MTDDITEPDMPTPILPGQAPPPAPVAGRTRLSFGNRLARALLVALFLLGFFFSVVPNGRAATRAVMLLPALIAAQQLAPVVANGEDFRHTSLTIPSQGGDVSLDVYAPTAAPPLVPGAREGVLILAGVGDERQEPQLVNLLESLARAGLVAMTMTTPTLLRYDLAPVDSDAVVQAFLKLSHWPGVGAGRVGILGFSAGGALACLAAADPRIHDAVASLTLFGGYFETTSLLRDFGRRALAVDGHLEAWQPNAVPVQVLGNAIGDTLPADQAQKIANALLVGGTPLSAADLAALSPPAAAAYHLLIGDQPDRVDANLAALSPAMLSLLHDLSPSAVVGQIGAPIYLLHDRHDPYVPFTQSRAFDAALTSLGHPHDFVEFSIFQHVEIRGGLGLGPLVVEGGKLYSELYKLLLVSA